MASEKENSIFCTQQAQNAGVGLLISSCPLLIEIIMNLFERYKNKNMKPISHIHVIYSMFTFLFGLMLSSQFDKFEIILLSFETISWFMLNLCQTIVLSSTLYIMSTITSTETKCHQPVTIVAILKCLLASGYADTFMTSDIKKFLTFAFQLYFITFYRRQTLNIWNCENNYAHTLCYSSILFVFSSELCIQFILMLVSPMTFAEINAIVSIYMLVLISILLNLIPLWVAQHDVLIYKEKMTAIKKSYQRYYAHELRNPMNIADMGVEFCLNKIPDDTTDIELKAVRDTLVEIKIASEDSLAVLNNFLACDKIDCELLKLQTKPLNVLDFIYEKLDNFKIQIRAKKISLELKNGGHDCYETDKFSAELPSSVPKFTFSASSSESLSIQENDVIVADRVKLSQVLRNVICNAIKCTSHNGTINISIAFVPANEENTFQTSDHCTTTVMTSSESVVDPIVDIGTTENGFFQTGMLVIEIQDSRVSMNAENRTLKEIVEFCPETLHAGGGNGLGLWISKNIVDTHGGRFDVYSLDEKNGSAFRLEIPMTRTSAHTSAPLSPPVTETIAKINANERLMASQIQRINSTNCLLGFNSDTELDLVTNSQRSLSVTSSISNGGSDVTSTESITFSNQSFTNENSHASNTIVKSTEHDASESSTFQNTTNGLFPTTGSAINTSYDSSISKLQSESVKLKKSTDSLLVKPKKFLIVDDVDVIRKMLRKLLEQRGHICDEAEDGLIALNMVKSTLNPGKTSYDAIFMDFVMPEMNGPDATRAIRNLGYTGQIIGATGNSHTDDQSIFMNAGLTDILIKPLKMEQLKGMVEV